MAIVLPDPDGAADQDHERHVRILDVLPPREAGGQRSPARSRSVSRATRASSWELIDRRPSSSRRVSVSPPPRTRGRRRAPSPSPARPSQPLEVEQAGMDGDRANAVSVIDAMPEPTRGRSRRRAVSRSTERSTASARLSTNLTSAPSFEGSGGCRIDRRRLQFRAEDVVSLDGIEVFDQTGAIGQPRAPPDDPAPVIGFEATDRPSTTAGGAVVVKNASLPLISSSGTGTRSAAMNAASFR